MSPYFRMLIGMAGSILKDSLMLKEHTALILGAGASYDLNFPLGVGLSAKVQEHCRDINKTDSLIEALISAGGIESAKLYRDRIKAVARGIPTARSIDDYLHRRDDDPAIVRLVKLCVTAEIVRAERFCAGMIHDGWRYTPYPVSPDNSEPRTKWWLGEFLVRVFEGVQQTKLTEGIQAALQSLSVVTFNYDRAFEYFLLEFMLSAFGLPSNEGAKLIKQHLRIFHIYGSVKEDSPIGANLHDQFSSQIKFSSVAVLRHIIHGAEGIRTIHEAEADGKVIANARGHIAKAKTLLCIGNSYIEQNISLLGNSSNQPRILGTAVGLSDEHRDQAKALLVKTFRAGTVTLKREWTAAQMISDIVETL